MSKLIKFLLITVPLVLLIAAAALYFSLNSIVKHGVEALGPEATQTEVRLDKSDISIFSGEGELRGLFVGNPVGFKSESAFKVSEVRMELEGMSIFKETVVLDSIYIESPEITYERSRKNTNINSIVNNIRAFAGAAKEAARGDSSKTGKKLRIKEIWIKSGKVNLSSTALGGQQVTLELQDIHLTDIGTAEGGLPASEALAEVMVEVNKSIAAAVRTQTGGTLQRATEKIKGFFSK